jgi:heme/copper-type cytochrome/quinol oxidase subunit 3
MSRPPTLDVHHLPSSALDAEHPVWWGNTLLLCVETTIVTLLLVSYFYIRKNFEPWPPPRVDLMPPLPRGLPALGAASVNTVLLLLSCIPMAWVDRHARTRIRAGIRSEEMPTEPLPDDGGHPAHTMSAPVLVFVGLVVLAGLSTALRFHEFGDLRFRWYDNAYGSVTWSLLGAHLTYLVMSLVEVGLLAWWVWTRGFTVKFALDTTLAAASWYWTVGIWLVIYAVVFWSPRWLPG